MKSFLTSLLISGAMLLASSAKAQKAQPVKGADERFKADILVVVAHPDDEGAVTPYLARAIYDLHKRVAVVFGTHGGSGGNSYSSERAGALADMREIEARDACARLGIKNVWFLDGKDTASQNVLNSLANWGHGANLEKLVQLIRLTRPDVVIASFPGVFIGENHGDHQATGVLATEAFDLAGSAAAFPSQLAAAMPQREIYQENLNSWQPKKLYFYADAQDDKQFAGSGPAYSINEVSPSQKKPYWRLAIDAAMTHLTQYPEEIHALEKLSDAELEKRMGDPDTGWWSDPETLIFGKSYYLSKPTDDVFANLDGKHAGCLQIFAQVQTPPGTAKVKLGGPWGFYEVFRQQHCLSTLPVANPPEIAIKSGTPLSIPLDVDHNGSDPLTVTVSADLPNGWRLLNGGSYALPLEARTSFRVEIETPTLSKVEPNAAKPELITVHLKQDNKPPHDIQLRVLLRSGGLPE